ncbi:phosphoribosylglycinamide formyltransferase [Lacticaseibacillus paracasei]|nr:phosphoribosylglycinamide formyltransferase [Lacticaseibacillus paracasei]
MKVTGVTVHFVDAGIDTGEIIAQVPVNITDGMSLAELEQAIHRHEHQIFPATVKNLIQEGAI